jgi:hypothetical protein
MIGAQAPSYTHKTKLARHVMTGEVFLLPLGQS